MLRQKVLVSFGTRPEVIKLAPVCRALAQEPDQFDLITCHTGQHRELVEPLWSLFELNPTFNLDVMTPNQTLSSLTTRLLPMCDHLIEGLRPDWVVVQGDTTSAYVMALAASYQRRPVAHVEAGLRTGDTTNPFPEELNRCMITTLSSLHFTPTDQATQNLLDEGEDLAQIVFTGNTIVDAVDWIRPRLDPTSPIDGPYVLVTFHRRESFGKPLQEILAALRQLQLLHPELRWVVLTHPNPQVSGCIASLNEPFMVQPPARYESFLRLLEHCQLVLTDSGGVTEEATCLKKPTVILRYCTERQESVDAGHAVLCPPHQSIIVEQVNALLNAAPNGRAALKNPYGDGQAALRIVQCLKSNP